MAQLPDNPTIAVGSTGIGKPEKMDAQIVDHILDDDDPNSLKKDLPITETEGYKSWLKLLQLVFKDDRKEITR